MAYIKNYANRHFIQPARDRVKGDLDNKELMYVWGTNTMFWLGVFQEMLQEHIKSKLYGKAAID